MIEELADISGFNLSAARKAGIFQNGEIELDLGNGLRLRTRRQFACKRQLEGDGVKTPILHLVELEEGLLPLRREAHLRHPQGAAGPRRIKGFERGEIIPIEPLA